MIWIAKHVVTTTASNAIKRIIWARYPRLQTANCVSVKFSGGWYMVYTNADNESFQCSLAETDLHEQQKLCISNQGIESLSR